MHRGPTNAATWAMDRLPALLSLAMLAALAGCAAPAGQTTASLSRIPPGAAGAGYGTIVSVRTPPASSEPRRSVLAALGATGTTPDGHVELIVRGDDGTPISVMQDDAGGLRSGDRVALIPGLRTRIARLSGARTVP